MRLASNIVCLLACASCAGATRARNPQPSPPVYEVDAIRYGSLARFPVAALVAGADTARRMDIALMVWLVRAPGAGQRIVLMDAGFYRDKFIARWRPVDYVRPSVAVERAGIRAQDVTDIIISHVHWDHLDGADLFPNARIWIQRAEYEYYIGAQGEALKQAISPVHAAMLA